MKDESERFGLDSFKILGAMYAVGRLSDEKRLAPRPTLVCASEGNHGRAVARVAAQNRLDAKIYVAAALRPERIRAIENEGAEVIAVDGNYDDAVKQAALEAEHHGWQLISDTSWEGYEEIPRRIMKGYTRLMSEAEKQWQPERPPDLVLVQAGVGGLAWAVVSWLYRRYGARRPFVVICEPVSAASLMESFRAGALVTLPGPFDTMMVGLRCGRVSSAAWPLIAGAADAFMSVDDGWCEKALRLLARPRDGDPVVRAGASGACGLAGLLSIMQEEDFSPLRAALNLNVRTRVLVIITEGVTDPELYAQMVGPERREIMR